MKPVAVRNIERADGILGLDIYGMRPKLEAAGIAYVDSASDLDD